MMMKLRNLSVRYHGADRESLSGIDLDIEPGKTLLIAGATGSGKSTLLMGMNGILHHESSARLQGEVRLGNVLLQDIPLKRICEQVGTVFQNPVSQICTGTPEREVAFGLENLGVERAEMKRRIDCALELTELTNKRLQKTDTLSGGQKQRLVIAAALAQNPGILLLDEPLSQLDPKGAEEILQVLDDLKCTSNIAVVMVEHRLEGPLRIADEVIIMDKGRIVKRARPRELFSDHTAFDSIGIQAPPLLTFFHRLNRIERPLFADEAPMLTPKRRVERKVRTASTEELLTVRDLDFAYKKGQPLILKGMSFCVYKGDRIALIGANGTGKSTLLHLLVKSLKPTRGTIERYLDNKGPVGLVMQNPDVMLIADSVEEELFFAPRQLGKSRDQCKDTVRSVLHKMGLFNFASRAPFSLSRGERQRTAAASVLTQEPSILLLDEPTTGQDRGRVDEMMSSILEKTAAAIFATHDMETAAKHANRVILLNNGGIAADGAPEEVLFESKILEAASIRPSEMQRFAEKHHLKTLLVEEMVEVFA
jgi:energy-coupling factor transport system ATP-binding protein